MEEEEKEEMKNGSSIAFIRAVMCATQFIAHSYLSFGSHLSTDTSTLIPVKTT